MNSLVSNHLKTAVLVETNSGSFTIQHLFLLALVNDNPGITIPTLSASFKSRPKTGELAMRNEHMSFITRGNRYASRAYPYETTKAGKKLIKSMRELLAVIERPALQDDIDLAARIAQAPNLRLMNLATLICLAAGFTRPSDIRDLCDTESGFIHTALRGLRKYKMATSAVSGEWKITPTGRDFLSVISLI